MNKDFKQLLLKIAALPLADQQWVLRQLTETQQKQFLLLQGHDLLLQARRFRKIPCPEIALVTPTSLPDLCDHLRQESSFYIALILDQGQFHWQEQFLRTHEDGEEIQKLMDNEISTLKSATKSSAFRQWQNRLSFEDQLEMEHG